MEPIFLARRIVAALERSKIGIDTETGAQRSVERALSAARIDFTPQVRLTDGDRIDLMCDAVGVEIKVTGERRSIYRQMERYCRTDQVQVLVLATAIAFPPPGFIGGKPVLVASLTKGWI